nr:hypothetical protein CFP56_00197 [Quercus suber]
MDGRQWKGLRFGGREGGAGACRYLGVNPGDSTHENDPVIRARGMRPSARDHALDVMVVAWSGGFHKHRWEYGRLGLGEG